MTRAAARGTTAGAGSRRDPLDEYTAGTNCGIVQLLEDTTGL